jgi:hypothetical protein
MPCLLLMMQFSGHHTMMSGRGGSAESEEEHKNSILCILTSVYVAFAYAVVPSCRYSAHIHAPHSTEDTFALCFHRHMSQSHHLLLDHNLCNPFKHEDHIYNNI